MCSSLIGFVGWCIDDYDTAVVTGTQIVGTKCSYFVRHQKVGPGRLPLHLGSVWFIGFQPRVLLVYRYSFAPSSFYLC